jgi:hypothetical protein
MDTYPAAAACQVIEKAGKEKQFIFLIVACQLK